MNKVWIITRHEFSTAVKRLSYIIMTLSLPLLALLGMLAYYGITQWAGEEPPLEKPDIGYVDNVGIFDEYTTADGATFVIYATEDEAQQALFGGDVVEYFVIPADYMETGDIDRYITKRELEPPYSTLNLIENFLIANLLTDDVSGETLARVQNPLYAQSLRLDPETGEIVPPEDEVSAFVMPYAFGLLFLMSLFFSSGYLLQGVAEEKENRLIEILLSSVSARQLLIGKVLGLGVAGLLQIVIWLMTAFIFVTVASTSIVALGSLSISVGMIFLAILYFILGYLLFGVLFAAIGSIGSTARESNQWTTLVVLPAVLPLMLIGLFITNPDHIVYTIFTLFPITAPIAAIMKLSIGSLPLWELVASIAIMIVSIVAATWLASKVFRTFLLMYGKRPGIKDIWRYLREA
ncbi:MAG: ABC transporter permease [Chloroflexota bacterium]|nr:ABC transporter permease [Chloroflexota bacterium]